MYSINIEKETLNNKLYRKELFTVPKQMQLVVMSLEQGEEIPLETHKGSQFVRIESGKGIAKAGKRKVQLKDGVSIIIPPNTPHVIYNTGTEPLKLYAIYTPPEHHIGARQRRMQN